VIACSAPDLEMPNIALKINNSRRKITKTRKLNFSEAIPTFKKLSPNSRKLKIEKLQNTQVSPKAKSHMATLFLTTKNAYSVMM